MTTTTDTSATLADTWADATAEWVAQLTADEQYPNLAWPSRDRHRIEQVAVRLDAGPWSVTGEEITAALYAAQIAPAEQVAALAALRRFYAWASAARLVRTSPLEVLPIGSWDAAVTAFADHLARQGRPSEDTAAVYCRRVLNYGRELPTGPWEVTGPMLQNDMDTRNWSDVTRKGTLVALRQFYRWAVQAGRVERSPLLGVTDGNPARPGPRRHSASAGWREPIGDYLMTLRAAGRRPATLELRRWQLNRLSQEFTNPWAVTPDQLALFMATDGWSPDFRRSYLNTIRQFYRWASGSGRLAVDPSMALLPVRVPRAFPRPAPDDAVLEAFERADERTRLAIELGMYAGLRISEVACLQDSDVLADRLRVTGKGGHQRMVPIHPTLAESLAAHRSRRLHAGVTSPWLFPSPRGTHLSAKALGNNVSRALPGGWTHHTLRHKFATQAYAQSRDLLAVQELLGHSKPETTARYAQVPDGALHDAVSGVGLPLDRNRKVFG